MITGIVTTDITNCYDIKLTQLMQSPMTNSYWFLRGICEGTNVVTDQPTWKRLSRLEEIPASVPVMINIDPEVVARKFSVTPMTIIGTHVVLQNLKLLDRLIHVQYRETAEHNKETLFPFPDVKPNKLAVLPHFDLYEYVLNEGNYEVQL